jgi:hypothetical protein
MGKWLPILSRVVTKTVFGDDPDRHWNVVQNNGMCFSSFLLPISLQYKKRGLSSFLEFEIVGLLGASFLSIETKIDNEIELDTHTHTVYHTRCIHPCKKKKI